MELSKEEKRIIVSTDSLVRVYKKRKSYPVIDSLEGKGIIKITQWNIHEHTKQAYKLTELGEQIQSELIQETFAEKG